jgi:hypothetical protein
MTPEQRLRKTIEVSRAALRFAAAPRLASELDALHPPDASSGD